eukprot:TRINITY_DN2785_c0_g1_i1.p2 TRINITY_DN2785_c0_g1~~TRINITY_DN2785_c0_g1_i1.p2  ORF type:complete len:106 (+),score=16.06 TRINITY_DN2785_c0_g1_i1:463-780(+)
MNDTEMGQMNRDSMNYGSSYRSRFYERVGRHMSDEGDVPEPTRSNQGEVVEHSITLLIFCSRVDGKLLEILYRFPHLKDTIVQGLLSNPIAHLRKSLSGGIFQIL